MIFSNYVFILWPLHKMYVYVRTPHTHTHTCIAHLQKYILVRFLYSWLMFHNNTPPRHPPHFFFNNHTLIHSSSSSSLMSVCWIRLSLSPKKKKPAEKNNTFKHWIKWMVRHFFLVQFFVFFFGCNFRFLLLSPSSLFVVVFLSLLIFFF